MPSNPRKTTVCYVWFFCIFLFLKYILLIMLLQFSQFFPLCPPSTLHPPTLQHSPALSSCPWVVRISSLSSLFPIPFLTSPHLFNAYQLCFFFLVAFPLNLECSIGFASAWVTPHQHIFKLLVMMW